MWMVMWMVMWMAMEKGMGLVMAMVMAMAMAMAMVMGYSRHVGGVIMGGGGANDGQMVSMMVSTCAVSPEMVSPPYSRAHRRSLGGNDNLPALHDVFHMNHPYPHPTPIAIVVATGS